MLDELAFLEVIRESPLDDSPRLMYADFLEERGDPAGIARAEFIRLECLLARGISDFAIRSKAESRRSELLTQHWRVWVRPICQALGEPVPVGPITVPKRKLLTRESPKDLELAREELYFLKRLGDDLPFPHSIEQYRGQSRDLPYLHSLQFRRGFVSHVSITNKIYRNATHIQRLFEKTPVEGLALFGWNVDQFSKLLDVVDLSGLRTLELIYCDSQACAMARSSPQFLELNRLIVRQPYGELNLSEALIGTNENQEPPDWNLKELLLSDCALRSDTFIAMWRSSWAKKLECLSLVDCSMPAHFFLMDEFLPQHRPCLRRLLIDRHSLTEMEWNRLPEVYGEKFQLADARINWPEMFHQR